MSMSKNKKSSARPETAQPTSKTPSTKPSRQLKTENSKTAPSSLPFADPSSTNPKKKLGKPKSQLKSSPKNGAKMKSEVSSQTEMAPPQSDFVYIDVDMIPTDDKYVPQYKSDEAACCDLVARIPKDAAGQTKILLSNRNGAKIGTGMTVAIPKGWKICIAAKSGFSERGLVCTNAPAQIDSDFRGEIMVLAMSLGREIIEINDGERFAQCWIEPAYRIRFNKKDILPETERGTGGFGSTGILT